MFVTFIGSVAWAYLTLSILTAFFFDSFPKRVNSAVWLVARSLAAFWCAPLLARIIESYLTDTKAILMWSTFGLFIYFSWIYGRFLEKKKGLYLGLITDTIFFVLVAVVDVAVLHKLNIKDGVDIGFPIFFLMFINLFLMILVYACFSGKKGRKKKKVFPRRYRILTAEERSEMIKEICFEENSDLVSDEELQRIYREYKREEKRLSFKTYEQFKAGMIGAVYVMGGFIIGIPLLDFASKKYAVNHWGMELSQIEVFLLYSVLSIGLLALMIGLWWVVSPEHYHKTVDKKRWKPIPPFPFYRRFLNMGITAFRSFTFLLILYMMASIGFNESLLRQAESYSPLIHSLHQTAQTFYSVLPAYLVF